MSSYITPGFLTLHGNQMEQLRAAVFDWVRNNPLDPLEKEVFLVQSNGIAEWLKIALAEEMGVCASTEVSLPARFLWEAYRCMLGRASVAGRSPYDKSPLAWRLMRLLPALKNQPDFAPLRHFLGNDDPERRLQLAQRLADLMDQYQVYRADWLRDWAEGRDVLRPARGDPIPLGPDQLWQAQLWRAIIASVPEEKRESGRVNVHMRFLEVAGEGLLRPVGLPRRVVLFGISALPYQTLQALAALSAYTQVLLAVPNPCQFYWGDIIQGRDLLTARRRRQPHRNARDLSAIPHEELHAHCHPLLAGWGRLGRDFIRMLDEFDDAQASQERFSNVRIDLFSEGEGETLLEQVQASIRDLLPLDEHPRLALEEGDCSIEFHITHSVQREVEVLHDRLLGLFAQPATEKLRPRDVVVMVPDIETFSPAVRAVFGQYGIKDSRYIPFEIADLKQRNVNPMLVALEWLLRLPQQRCLQSEVRDLLDVPAIAARFGLEGADLPRLGQWIEGAGVRWGLDRSHRAGLGLEPAGEQNAWIFGMRRMLLGYASGSGASFADIEPYAEVGGLDAALAGSLAHFVEALLQWRKILAEPASPAIWSTRARDLLKAFFSLNDEHDRLTYAQLEESLQCWLEFCQGAQFDEDIPLAVLREAWLGAIDEPTLNQRFVSGGVIFCTLMPMRAVPFRLVCLLGMNDGDFPRRAQHADFDLLAQPGLARPGDRSRRDDDRYLMLEALLAAREKLYISWVGRNVRDNSQQPPSVLVSQLRDYLRTGWDLDLSRMTTEHPLQPFSRRYFEQDGLLTYAREWRAAHAESDFLNLPDDLPPFQPGAEYRLRLRELAGFMRNPAKYFFRHRLQVVFGESRLVGQDDEPFSLNGLEEYAVVDNLLDDSGVPEELDQVHERLRQRAARLKREGLLPIGQLGAQWLERLVETLVPVRSEWLKLGLRFPQAADKLPVRFEQDGLLLDDWIDKLRGAGDELVWLQQISSKAANKAKEKARGEKLIDGWLRQLAAAALGHRVTGYLVARDVVIVMAPLDPDKAREDLARIMSCWRDGMNRPLPTACRAALEWHADGDPQAIYDGDFLFGGEVADHCLARLWPNFEALSAEPDWIDCSTTLYGALASWLQTQIEIRPIEGVPAEEAAA